MLTFGVQQVGALNILCLGAHCDDIEIGCGGAILRFIEERPQMVNVHWVVFSSTPEREVEARMCAQAFLAGAAAVKVEVHSYRDGFFPQRWAEIKEEFERLKREFDPAIVFTHTRDDFHQDHRVVCDLTWNTFRNHIVLEYEIPKYDGDLGRPCVFVQLSGPVAKKKASLIMGHYRSQASKHWFTEDTILSLLRLRGVESAATTKYAEGFFGRKIVI